MIRGSFASDEQDNSVIYYDDMQDFDQTIKISRPNAHWTSLRSNTEEIPNHLRESWNLSTDLKDHFEYTSLERSLLSGLPNEIELALNTILLMSSQPNCFSISRNPRLLDLLLSSVGVSCPDIDFMRNVPNSYTPAQSSTAQQLRYLSFWESNVDNEDGRVFLSPTAFNSNFSETVRYRRLCSSPTIQEMTYGDEEAFRIQLVATVLRNLAVDDGLSAVIIGRHSQALRFIFLCIYAKHSCLHQLGLEILSSLYFPVLGSLTSALHRLLTTLLVCPDRIDRIRGLQIVKNLCTAPLFDMTYDRVLPAGIKRVSFAWTDRNIAFLTSLPPATFLSITSTLCLKDLHLVVLAVDTVYSLTCLGPSLCDRLLQKGSTPEEDATASLGFRLTHQNTSLLPLLISLLNLEAQAMGSDSLIRVRVMQALGTESANTKSSVSKPNSLTVPPPTKVIPSTAQTTAIPYLPNKDSVIMCTTNSTVQLPIHCSQPNLTLSLNQPSHCASQRSGVQDTCAITSTVKTFISASQNYRHPNVINCHSCSTGPTVSVADSLATGNQALHPRVNKRDLLVRSCLPIITNSRVSCPVREVGTIMHSTQQNPGSVSANKPALSVIQTSSSTLPSNVLSVSHGTPSVNDVKSKVCLPQQTCTLLINNPSTNTSSEIQKQTNPSSKLLATENGLPHLDRREFMFEWLKSNYAVHNHSSIPRIQIYNEYQKAHLQRFRNIGAVSPVDFHSQIKTIFPGVGQVKVQVPGGSVEIHYNNLKHVNAPEPESQQGINDIMASVLSPVKMETNNHEARSPKNKCRKRVATGTPLHPTSPKLTSKTEDTSNHVLKNSRVDVRELNGHPESVKLTNGQLIHPLNGLPRDTNDVTNNINSTVHNGLHSVKLGVSASNMNEDSCCVQKKPAATVKATAVVSLPDSKIMIVPVFAAYGVGHNLAVKQPPTNETPVVPNTGKPELNEVQNTNETFTSAYASCRQTSTVVKADANVVKSTTPLCIATCNPDLGSKSITVTSDNHINGISKIPVGNTRLRCKWGMCEKEFSEPSELWSHFKSTHYETVRDLRQVKCVWEDCSEVILNTALDSLLNHFNSKHSFPLSSRLGCIANNDHSMAAGNASQSVCELSRNDASNPSPCEIEKPLVYDELNLSSILSEECRRALTGGIPNPPFAPTPVHEGPVTKHLRLTAALALRNLLQYSDVARRYVSSCENILCDLAFANLESSPTILECLTLLSNPREENSQSQSSLDIL
ncbi:unnamed protein product [Trichobilharzia szidati]|nr:unnamed protein product [Trichobilharzia szidati]